MVIRSVFHVPLLMILVCNYSLLVETDISLSFVEYSLLFVTRLLYLANISHGFLDYSSRILGDD